MYSLPTTITITNGKQYAITNDGDYRIILQCFEAIGDAELSEDERVLASLLIFYNEFNSFDDLLELTNEEMNELITSMFNFFNCNQPEGVGHNAGRKLIDWQQDEHIIVSAINNVAHTEVRSLDYLHWFTFMGYYLSVGESVLSTVVSIRDKIIHGKKLEDFERKFKQNNPQYFNWQSKTADEIAMDEYVKSLWNKGDK